MGTPSLSRRQKPELCSVSQRTYALGGSCKLSMSRSWNRASSHCLPAPPQRPQQQVCWASGKQRLDLQKACCISIPITANDQVQRFHGFCVHIRKILRRLVFDDYAFCACWARGVPPARPRLHLRCLSNGPTYGPDAVSMISALALGGDVLSMVFMTWMGC